jgi:hypothetical protein
MIRNLIDYSEYRVQRSNFEFWDQLNDKKETKVLHINFSELEDIFIRYDY